MPSPRLLAWFIALRCAAGSAAAAEVPVHFANDVAPLFSKHGCNSGGCHGKASGQNGFKLSLFAADPAFDYDALVKEARGRRVFAASPRNSLLLRKATGTAPHGGGRRIEPGSASYEILLAWLRQGCPVGSPDAPTLTAIAVEPRQCRLARGQRLSLSVTARYSDGSSRDVTGMAEYQSNEPAVATVDAEGVVATHDQTGEAAVLARYMGQVAVCAAAVPRDRPPKRGANFTCRNFIDTCALRKWQALGIAPSPPASDAEFLRRTWLDICGMLPTPEQARAYLDSRDQAKRDRLIDYLLERREYSSFFALKWADIVRNASLAGAERVSAQLQEWLRAQIALNRPFDEIVRGIVAADGTVRETPGVNWLWQMRDDLPWQPTADTAQVFLGTRLACAQCHHHPFERWSQDDYYGLAGFYGRLRMEGGDVNTLRFTFSPTPTRNDPRTGQPMRPRPLGGRPIDVPAHEDPREYLVEWMRRPDNPFFARALVNRYWAHFMGRGLVEPVDDLRDTNPPTNPELLDELARDFIRSNFDLKRLVRTITTSSTYRLSSAPTPDNADDRQNHARYYARRLQAEVLSDLIDQVTLSPTHFGGMSRTVRAKELPHEAFHSYFLDVFGRPPRTSGCECARGQGPSLAQALHLLNAPEIENKLNDPAGRAARLSADRRPDPEKVGEVYLAAFCRPPTSRELDDVLATLRKMSDSRHAFQDLIWAVINSREFAFNH
jgi:hypothetical protein